MYNETQGIVNITVMWKNKFKQRLLIGVPAIGLLIFLLYYVFIPFIYGISRGGNPFMGVVYILVFITIFSIPLSIISFAIGAAIFLKYRNLEFSFMKLSLSVSLMLVPLGAYTALLIFGKYVGP